MIPPLTPEPSAAFILANDPDELGVMATDALRWWLDNGASLDAVTKPWAVGASHVTYDNRGGYEPNACGEFAYVFGALSMGLIDLIAWSPRIGRIASRLGQAIALGEQQAIEARNDITGRPLAVWRTPLGWLRAGRRGIVIVDHDRAAYLLAGLNIRPEDSDHARELRATLRVRQPRIAAA